MKKSFSVQSKDSIQIEKDESSDEETKTFNMTPISASKRKSSISSIAQRKSTSKLKLSSLATPEVKKEVAKPPLIIESSSSEDEIDTKFTSHHGTGLMAQLSRTHMSPVSIAKRKSSPSSKLKSSSPGPSEGKVETEEVLKPPPVIESSSSDDELNTTFSSHHGIGLAGQLKRAMADKNTWYGETDDPEAVRVKFQVSNFEVNCGCAMVFFMLNGKKSMVCINAKEKIVSQLKRDAWVAFIGSPGYEIDDVTVFVGARRIRVNGGA